MCTILQRTTKPYFQPSTGTTKCIKQNVTECNICSACVSFAHRSRNASFSFSIALVVDAFTFNLLLLRLWRHPSSWMKCQYGSVLFTVSKTQEERQRVCDCKQIHQLEEMSEKEEGRVYLEL
jgi:hypothetical protein